MKTIRRDNPPAIFASVTGRSFVPPKDALLVAESFRPEQMLRQAGGLASDPNPKLFPVTTERAFPLSCR